MRIALLGELDVRADDDRVVVVTGAKQRALLAMLALHSGRVVPVDQLIEGLWGEDPPAAVRNGLQGLVSKLRRALGSAELLAMRGGGYALDLAPDAIDVHRYEELLTDAFALAAREPEQAIVLLGRAEALWRGDPLSEFVYDEFASATFTRLTELRLAATEARFDAELRLGRHHGVIGPLEALVAAHPLRERLRGLLMVGLYRAGRQADALRTYQEGRLLLGEELGLEPGPELRQLEVAILAQDPSLDGRDQQVPSQPLRQAKRRPQITASLTPLVGREDELRELVQLFDDRRLITLVGPGGVGKTRLALEVGRDRSASLADGGCLVELAPVGDPAGVRAAIASALELPDPNQLAAMIGERELLIVLDNCEHVIATAAAIAEDLLRRCPGLRLLATSREGLRVGGETIWPVPPLAADDAVELFVTRAQAAGARFALTDDTAACIAEICSRLDGLPLAVELAAARARAFPVPQILSRLNDRFRLLTGGSRTALPRQQTLRAVVDWSYELLFADEQHVFERLSVLPGGCDLATAQAVCADDEIPAPDVEDIIRALIDKSLVIAVPSSSELRVTQLQTLAQYGRERLAERGESARIRDAMAAHFTRQCERSAAAFTGDSQRAWFTSMDQEQDNLRGALEWAVANDDAQTALTIAGGACWFHWLAGTTVEGKRWLDDAFACRGDVDEITRGMALTGRALIDFQLGMPDGVDADLEEALDIFRRHGALSAMSLAYSFYAEFAAVRGEHVVAQARRREVLAFYDAQPDDAFVLACRDYSLAKLGMLDGDLAAAERCYRAATEAFARIDRPVMLSMCLGMVADFDERSGDFRAAIEKLEAAIATNESLGLRGFTGALLTRLGWALLQHGDPSQAEAMYRQAEAGARRLNNRPVIFLALTGLAVLHRRCGRAREAVDAATEALDIYVAGSPRRLANRVDPRADVLTAAAVCCTVLAAVAADDGDGVRAAHLLGQADRMRTDAGVPAPAFLRDDLERAHATATVSLGPSAFAAAFVHGGRGRLGDDVVYR